VIKMDEFLGRIGFGCARLSGGLAERNSRRVVAAALDCGIRYFDTAPAYGGGASERILAAGLRGLRDDVQVCTKVGLPRAVPNRRSEVKTLILATIRSVLPETAVARLNRIRHSQVKSLPSRPSCGNFAVPFVRSSVAQSLHELQTDRLDTLLLHEPRMSDPDADVAAVLQGYVSAGTVRRLGVATGSGRENLPAFGAVAQFKLGSTTRPAGDSRRQIGHGLLRGLDASRVERGAHETGVFTQFPTLKLCLAEPLGPSALLLNAVLFGTNIDRVLVSTTSATRLVKFISTATQIFGEIRARDNVERAPVFGALVLRYFDPSAAGR
jgi:Aldo/keto reductase family